MDPTPDADLVRATLAGDRTAFDALTRRYERSALAAARAVLRDRHAAEDAAQAGFLTAYSRLADLRDPAAFGGWLLRIVRNAAVREAGKVRATVPPTGEAAADAADLGEDSRQLLAAVTALPEAEAQVVMLYYFDGRTVPELAALLGRPVGTVTKQLSRAYARLRTRLEEKR